MEGTAWKVAGLEALPRGEIDEKQEPLLALVEGKLPAYIYCEAPMDVHRALEIARENGFLANTTLVLNTRCWKAAAAVAEAGVPAVLTGPLTVMERDPITGDETEIQVPKVFRDKGVRFALSSMNATTQSLWYQAATAVSLGLERAQALAAVTTVPAEILGVGKRVGSLEVGKDANVVLFSGDPLSVNSFVERVVLEGEAVYDRKQDVRWRQLLEGKTPTGTAPMEQAGAETPTPPPDEHKDGDEPAKPPEEQGKKPGDGHK